MIKPRQYDAHKALLSAELLAESEWLAKNSRLDAEGRQDRAEAFNDACRKIGAYLMIVYV